MEKLYLNESGLTYLHKNNISIIVQNSTHDIHEYTQRNEIQKG